MFGAPILYVVQQIYRGVGGFRAGMIWWKNSIAFGKAPQREANNLPISQALRQAVSQAVGRASKQAGRQVETHSLAFFHRGLHLQTVGDPKYARPIGDRVVEHSICVKSCRFYSPPAFAGADQSSHCSFSPDPVSNPSKHKLLTPPPPPPLKCDIQFQGDRGLKIKNPLRDQFVRQNDDFTSNKHPISCLRVCYTNDPQKGGCTGPRLSLI